MEATMPSVPTEWAAMADELVDLGEHVLKLSNKLDAMNAVLLSIDARLATLQPTSATGETGRRELVPVYQDGQLIVVEGTRWISDSDEEVFE